VNAWLPKYLTIRMSQPPTGSPFARTEVRADGLALVTVGGVWTLDDPLPAVVIRGDRVKVVAEGLGDFDSSLPAWLHAHGKNIRDFDLSDLPARLQSLVLMAEKAAFQADGDEQLSFLEQFGTWGVESGSSWARAFEHIGHTAAGFARMLVGRAKVNWSDFTLQLQTAGVDALPIVALLGFLTGLIMAYVGLIQLRQVGATVYVANLVSLAMTREMGALMTGVIACGRTSTAFASQLGSMNVSQETDALRALGIQPVEYLAVAWQAAQPPQQCRHRGHRHPHRHAVYASRRGDGDAEPAGHLVAGVRTRPGDHRAGHQRQGREHRHRTDMTADGRCHHRGAMHVGKA
jgi:phospholipid/cholesterol/gamma-HCH transport system permease protein